MYFHNKFYCIDSSGNLTQLGFCLVYWNFHPTFIKPGTRWYQGYTCCCVSVKLLCLPPLWWGDILFLSCPSVTQFVSATPLKLLNRISRNLVDSKDTICTCAYYQDILIAWILWELCPFELRNFPKFTTEAARQHNSPETTKQNFMKLGR